MSYTDRPFTCADNGTRDLDHDRSFGKELLHPLVDEVRAVDLFVERLVHVLGRHRAASGLCRPVRGLPHEVRQVAEPERELVLFLGEPHGVVHHPRHRAPVEGEQAVVLHHVRDEVRVAHLLVVGCRGPGVEVGLDLEDVAEVLVVVVQEVVKPGAAEHDDLERHRDGFGLDPPRAEAVELRDVLDLHLVLLDDPLERVPGEGVSEHVEGVQEEVAAVGVKHRARPDHGEIRVETRRSATFARCGRRCWRRWDSPPRPPARPSSRRCPR